MNKLRSILLVLTAAAALSLAHPAKANTITFNVSGNCTPSAPSFTGTTFNGTLTIDVTAGTVTAMDINFLGLSPFNTITNSFATGGGSWFLMDSPAGATYGMSLNFTTGHDPASLVGFTGGTIGAGSAYDNDTNTEIYNILNGSITAPTGSVPDAGSTLPLLGFASLGLVALRRKLRC
jgi:hypothetical protein